ncbi:hypothetical protein Tco_1511952, partial [Tanacetum coccineum]
ERMITDRVAATLVVEQTVAAAKAAEVARAVAAAETTRVTATAGSVEGSNNAGPAAGAGGPNVAGPIVGFWFEISESEFLISKCAENDKFKYATSTLLDEALSWWNFVAQPIGIENAYKNPWGKVTSFDAATIDKAMRMARRLMDQAVRAGTILLEERDMQETYFYATDVNYIIQALAP